MYDYVFFDLDGVLTDSGEGIINSALYALEKYNIDKKRRHIANKFSEKEVYEIIELYQTENISCAKISKRYNVSEATIIRILRNNNINIRRHPVHKFDEHYFDSINTANKAYLLGFLYADGCVNKNNVISFTVHQKDREILEMYVSELRATNQITYIPNKPHVRIAFCSKHMCDTLIDLGCGHNKTNSLSFPNIPKEYIYDFIRGFMDGDGSISITKRNYHKYISLSFTGTKEMMNELKLLFEVDNLVSFYRNAYALHIGKTKDVMRILNKIYNNAELYLTRKFDKYQEYCDYINKGDFICKDQPA